MKNKKILLAVAVVLVILGIGALILIPAMSGEEPEPGTTATTAGTEPVETAQGTEPREPVQEPTISATEEVIYDYYPQVTFVTHGTEQTFRVTPGTVPQAPSGQSGYDHLVFVGWEPALAPVNEDTTYTAIYEDISEKDNVFVLDTLYTTADTAELTLSLRGKVKLSVADVQLSYDPNVIRVEELVKVDSSIQYNILPEEGRIKVSLLLDKNLEYSMDCFRLRVTFVDPAATLAQLDITVDDAAMLDSTNTLVSATSGTVSGKVVRIPG